MSQIANNLSGVALPCVYLHTDTELCLCQDSVARSPFQLKADVEEQLPGKMLHNKEKNKGKIPLSGKIFWVRSKVWTTADPSL